MRKLFFNESVRKLFVEQPRPATPWFVNYIGRKIMYYADNWFVKILTSKTNRQGSSVANTPAPTSEPIMQLQEKINVTMFQCNGGKITQNAQKR